MEPRIARTPWTWAGLAISLLGIPAVALVYRLAVGDTAGTGQLLLREGAILVLLGLLFHIIRRRERLPLSSIGLRRSGAGRTILWGLLVFVLLAAGTALALGLLHVLGLHYGGDHGGFVPPLWMTALIVLRAGIVEEVFYRGYAIERIAALSGSRAVAALVALAAFAGSHYHQGIAGILVATILGAILTGFYLWRRNLAANIVGHFLVDIISNVVLPALGA